MARGENKPLNYDASVQKYYKKVLEDIQELITHYPYTSYTLFPTSQPTPVRIRTVAADNRIIQLTCATEQDFLGAFSKELEIIVPFDYSTSGCRVYGGKWIDEEKIPDSERHFYERNSKGLFLFCVGVPESFPRMKNVILENVRTASSMLIAYELFQTGQTEKLELLAYSHGNKGRREYKNEKK